MKNQMVEGAREPMWLAEHERGNARHGWRGSYACQICGHVTEWTRDPLPVGANPRAEALAFYDEVQAEIYRHASKHPAAQA